METHLKRLVSARPLSNGRLGMMLLLGTETVLFSSFIGAYIVLKAGTPIWPPLGTPRLTLDLSVLNTGLLVVSSGMAAWFRWKIKQGYPQAARKAVVVTLGIGLVFLALQGVEFHRLYAQGLTLQRGVFGALFYSLITLHGLHVSGGLGFLAYLLWQWPVARDQSKTGNFLLDTGYFVDRVGHAELYWHFVTLVWLVLFGILYLD